LSSLLKYSHLLDSTGNLNILSLGEGNTPLIRSRQIGPTLGFDHLYFKLESLNPTGSYKDRFAALAVSGLLQDGAGLCLATSSGNTGAALAAYAAVAGIPCHIAVVDGAPAGKLRQMQAYGAHLWMVKDFGIRTEQTITVFRELQQVAGSYYTAVQISAFAYSPFGMQGVQTISFEIAEALPEVRHVYSPAGGGGLTLAVALGFERSESGARPKVHCVQPVGNDTIATPLRKGMTKARNVEASSTTISGLQVPNVIDGDEVIQACGRSGGTGYLVEDDEVYYWQERLASTEGIYCEPAGAVAVAGFVRSLKEKSVDRNDEVVCLITGHGFKDPGSTEKMIVNNPVKYISGIIELKQNLNESTRENIGG
jgi:threonine synthase